MLDSCKMLQKQSEAFHTFLLSFFPSLKQNFIAYRSSKVSSHPDSIFEIYQLWQSGFSRVYSNCCCSCSFETEIIKIGQSSHNMYSNNIVNFQEFTTNLNAYTKSPETYWRSHVLEPCQRTKKKRVKQKSDTDTNYSWWNRNGPQRPEKETGETGHQRKNWDHPNYTTIKNSSRIQETWGDLLSLRFLWKITT